MSEQRERLYSPIGNEDSYPELPGIVAEMLAEAWDEGRVAERRDWELLWDLSTPDEERQPLPNPYRSQL